MITAEHYPVSSTALLIVDPYNDFIAQGGKLWTLTKETAEAVNLVHNLKRLLMTARQKGIQVIYVPHHHMEEGDFENWKFPTPSHIAIKQNRIFEKGSWGGEYHKDLQPQTGDLIAQEHWSASGFANTDLDFLLKQHGLDHVVLTGLRANTCIESTGRYAVELGYHTTLISDAVAAFSWDEMKTTIEINFPAFAHFAITTEEFIARIKS